VEQLAPAPGSQAPGLCWPQAREREDGTHLPRIPRCSGEEAGRGAEGPDGDGGVFDLQRLRVLGRTGGRRRERSRFTDGGERKRRWGGNPVGGGSAGERRPARHRRVEERERERRRPIRRLGFVADRE
jgi:hypothetical protein